MSQKSLSNWLKIMILGVGICGILICVLVLPAMVGDDKLRQVKLVLLWLTGVPCYIALVFSWRIMSNIGRDQSFTRENAILLKRISILATVDALFLFVWNIVLWVVKANDLTMLLACLFVDFLGIVVAVIFAALSHLVCKAADLQEQSDLTI
ncbi:MAG: DUF2975 domain-containing protein [Tyzzerella sp.]|nr:DUF2975 domain-containing protein [Tyzzerella sp.]